MSASQCLAGVRVLLLEDNFLVALAVADGLRDLGAEVDGPHPSVAHARAAYARKPPRMALLDVSVQDGSSLPFASELLQAGVCVVFLTGYTTLEELPPELTNVPRLLKPVDMDAIGGTLRGCLDASQSS